MGFKVTAPLVIVPNADPEVGGDGYFYVDAVIPDGFNDERCKQLVDEGMLEKVKSSKADADSGGSGGSEKSDKVDDILKDVGDDKEKAQAALDAEQTKGDKARSTLVEKLQAVISAS